MARCPYINQPDDAYKYNGQFSDFMKSKKILSNPQEKNVKIKKIGTTVITPDYGFDSLSKVNVEVEHDGANAEEKTITVTTPVAKEEILPSDGYNCLSKVLLDVNIPMATREKDGGNINYNITKNGITEITVPNGYEGISDGLITVEVKPNLEEKTIEIETSPKQEVTPTEEFVGLSKISIDATKYGEQEKEKGFNQGVAKGKTEQKALLEEISITENGVFEKEDGYKKITVSVPKVGIDMSKSRISFSNSNFNIQEFEALNTYNWDKISSLRSMFSYCDRLEAIPNIDFSNINDMSNAFYTCGKIQAINMDCPKATTLYYTFYNCYGLTEAILNEIDNVTTMERTFYTCGSLKTATLGNTKKVANMYQMFFDCKALTELTLLNMDSVSNAGGMLAGCVNLEVINGFHNLSTDLYLSHCQKLSHDSLMTVINNAKDLTGSESKTITLGEANLAKLSEDEKAIATNKNWILA